MHTARDYTVCAPGTHCTAGNVLRTSQALMMHAITYWHTFAGFQGPNLRSTADARHTCDVLLAARDRVQVAAGSLSALQSNECDQGICTNTWVRSSMSAGRGAPPDLSTEGFRPDTACLVSGVGPAFVATIQIQIRYKCLYLGCMLVGMRDIWIQCATAEPFPPPAAPALPQDDRHCIGCKIMVAGCAMKHCAACRRCSRLAPW